MLPLPCISQALEVTGLAGVFNESSSGPFTLFAAPNFAWEQTFGDNATIQDIFAEV